MGILFESIVLDWICITAVLIAYAFHYINSAYNFWKVRGVKYIKPTAPFGNIRDLVLKRRVVAEVYRDLYNKFPDEPIVGIFEIFKPVLMIRDLELAKCILVKNFGHFQDRGFEFDEKLDPLCNHLIFVKGPMWRYLRTKLTPTFSSGKMKMMFHLMSERARELNAYLEQSARNEEAVEIKDIMSMFTIDIIGSCAFGINLNSLKKTNSEFREMGRRIFEPTFWSAVRRSLKFFTPKLATFLRIKGMSDDINNYFINITKEMIDYREKNNIVSKDFLQLLIKIKRDGKINDEIEEENENSKLEHQVTEPINISLQAERNEEAIIEEKGLTDNLLAAQLFVFFLAGFETSATTLSFCLYELAVNPDVQNRLRDDIDATIDEFGGNVTYECVQRMSYLNKVIDEVLRLYPPVHNLVRVVTKPYEVPGTNLRLEVGQKVVIPTCAMHYNPEYFPDPTRFDPERFSNEVTASRPNYSYMPFGEGPRNCIGFRFGKLETKLGLITLLSNYELSVCEKTAVPLVMDPKHMFLSPLDGLWLRIRKRN